MASFKVSHGGTRRGVAPRRSPLGAGLPSAERGGPADAQQQFQAARSPATPTARPTPPQPFLFLLQGSAARGA